jgi:hypothetical protein
VTGGSAGLVEFRAEVVVVMSWGILGICISHLLALGGPGADGGLRRGEWR